MQKKWKTWYDKHLHTMNNDCVEVSSFHLKIYFFFTTNLIKKHHMFARSGVWVENYYLFCSSDMIIEIICEEKMYLIKDEKILEVIDFFGSLAMIFTPVGC